jgi:serine phosphatase RsbU (regulator of sigma subunit)
MAKERQSRRPLPPEARGWELVASWRYPIEFALTSTPVYIGRGAPNDISLPGDEISRDHLMIEWDGAGWAAADLGSKNGTLLNGERIAVRQPLREGDKLLLGALEMVFRRAPVRTSAQFVEDAAPIDDLPTIVFPASKTRPEEGRILGVAPEIADRLAPAKLAALIRLGKELTGSLPLHELFTMILNLACKSVQADRGALAIFQNGELVIQAAQGDSVKISSKVRDRVVEQRSSLLISDARLDPSLGFTESLVGVQSLMAVPLQTSKDMIGLIYLASMKLLAPFTEEDLGLLTVFANTAAARIELARQIENERQLAIHRNELEQAAFVIRRLFPAAAPSVDGLDIAGQSVPCREVGGDYFTYCELPGGRTGVLIADVAGKGLSSAFLMTSFAADVRCLIENYTAPGELLRKLNPIVRSQVPGNRFITCVFAAIDPANGRIEWANAGHCRPLLVRPGGGVEILEGGGPVLGAFDSAEFETMSRNLEPGDRVMFFSDGIVESENADGEEFGEDRLQSLAVSTRAMGSSSALESVWTSFADFLKPVPPSDDMTCVMVSIQTNRSLTVAAQ